MWNATAIGSTGLTYKEIGPRPGTSAYASERYISYDEVHLAVVDTSTNTIVERMTYLSKISDAKSPEGSSIYWKDYVNEFSGYIYASALTTAEVTTLGEDPGGTAASYSATSAAPKELARILLTASKDLTGGADNYDYTSGEISTAYTLFQDTEDTDLDLLVLVASRRRAHITLVNAVQVDHVENTSKALLELISHCR